MRLSCGAILRRPATTHFIKLTRRQPAVTRYVSTLKTPVNTFFSGVAYSMGGSRTGWRHQHKANLGLNLPDSSGNAAGRAADKDGYIILFQPETHQIAQINVIGIHSMEIRLQLFPEVGKGIVNCSKNFLLDIRVYRKSADGHFRQPIPQRQKCHIKLSYLLSFTYVVFM